MNKLTYLLSRAKKMSNAQMKSAAEKIAADNSTSAARVMLDMIFCAAVYGAGYSDYSLFDFYNRSSSQRRTYLTRQKNNRMVVKYNAKDHIPDLDDKLNFNRIYSDFIGRGWLSLKDADRDSAIGWILSHDVFFAKQPENMCGKGIEKIITAEHHDISELYDSLISRGYYLIEEQVTQAAEISSLNPSCVNTVRVVTLDCNGKVNILAALVRIGLGKDVDNLNSGGIAAPVRIADGVISCPAADKSGNVYDSHPTTGVKIVGFRFPFWQETLEMINKAALVTPEIRYVGWDVAITDNGPLLIEGNAYPGNDIVQLPAHSADKKGFLPVIRRAEKGAD